MIACLASQPSFPAYTDGGNECWLVSWRTSHMSEAPCQPCKSFYFFTSTALCHPHFLGKSQISKRFFSCCLSQSFVLPDDQAIHSNTFIILAALLFVKEKVIRLVLFFLFSKWVIVRIVIPEHYNTISLPLPEHYNTITRLYLETIPR